MIAAAELAAQRRLTAMFIEADALEIQLLRPTEQPNGAGGVTKGDPAPVGGLQRMRLIPLSDGAEERMTADGRAVKPGYKLLGTHLADMQRGDTFELNGTRYEIVFISENKQYEIKGEAAYLGD
jgi:hypothetical protein